MDTTEQKSLKVTIVDALTPVGIGLGTGVLTTILLLTIEYLAVKCFGLKYFEGMAANFLNGAFSFETFIMIAASSCIAASISFFIPTISRFGWLIFDAIPLGFGILFGALAVAVTGLYFVGSPLKIGEILWILALFLVLCVIFGLIQYIAGAVKSVHPLLKIVGFVFFLILAVGFVIYGQRELHKAAEKSEETGLHD